MVGFAFEGERQKNLGCRSKHILEGLYRAGVLGFVVGCDDIWDSVGTLQTRLFPRIVVYLLPGKSPFLCSLSAARTDQYHRISGLIYLFIVQLQQRGSLCGQMCQGSGGFEAMGQGLGFFWGLFSFCLGVGFFLRRVGCCGVFFPIREPSFFVQIFFFLLFFH